jgi:hypothetical protein
VSSVEHLAAEVAALLLGRELVLVMHSGGARLDHRAHQLVRLERPAEAGFRIGDDREQPVGLVPLGRLDLHRPVGLPGEVRVGCDLPAGEVDRLQAGLRHLDGLAAGHRSERCDVLVFHKQAAQPFRPEAGECVLDPYRPAEALDRVAGVRAFEPIGEFRRVAVS